MAKNKEILTIENGVLKRCDEYFKGDLVIPDSVTEIGEAAFQSCNLKSVVIPNSVNDGRHAMFFYNVERDKQLLYEF